LAPRSLIAIASHVRGTQVLSRPDPGLHVLARDLPLPRWRQGPGER